MRNIDTIHEAYAVLKPNEAYWISDNDYKRKYQYICECVETGPNYAAGTLDYIAACASVLLKAHSRFFK